MQTNSQNLLKSEAATGGGALHRKGVLKNFANPQEKICAEVSF